MKNREEVKRISRLLSSQDNACTHEPVFMVQRHRRTYGFDPAYSDNPVYVNEDGREVTVDPKDPDTYRCPNEEHCNEPVSAEDMEEECCSHCGVSFDLGDWCLTRTAYQDTWENVMPFFTREGAEEYLRINGHNLQGQEPPRIYVESGYRNAEWQAIRNFLLEMSKREEP
jgi:hypothetical protein